MVSYLRTKGQSGDNTSIFRESTLCGSILGELS